MSSNTTLSPAVRRRTVGIDSAVRQKEPKPKKDTTYEFSNGRTFKELSTRNPYA